MRYAIYFTPAPETALWRLGSSILGYDAAAREAVALPEHALWSDTAFVRALETPARYGFHATLKPPFALAPGATEARLLDRAGALSARRAPICLPALAVTPLGDFVALCPVAEDAGLNRLAADCVRDFDDLRAPLGAEDRMRRVSQSLTPRQRANLDLWGYPYVLEDFRFHMTLTGALPKPLQLRSIEVLKQLYRRVGTSVCIDAISVLAQPTRESRFSLVARFPLRAVAPAFSLGR